MSNTAVVTPYGAAKIANAVIKEAGLPAIPPQMVYNYTVGYKGKNPLIPFTRGTDGKIRIKVSDVESWVKGYVERKLARQAVAA